MSLFQNLPGPGTASNVNVLAISAENKVFTGQIAGYLFDKAI
jgi:hypothetical protein